MRRVLAALVVTLAASAGGLAALRCILSTLPADFGAPILAIIHLDPRQRSILAPLLQSRTSLKVVNPAGRTR